MNRQMELAEAIMVSKDEQVEVVYDTGERERLRIDTALLGNSKFAAVLKPGGNDPPYTLLCDFANETTPSDYVPLYRVSELAVQVQEGSYPDLADHQPARGCQINERHQMASDTLNR